MAGIDDKRAIPNIAWFVRHGGACIVETVSAKGWVETWLTSGVYSISPDGTNAMLNQAFRSFYTNCYDITGADGVDGEPPEIVMVHNVSRITTCSIHEYLKQKQVANERYKRSTEVKERRPFFKRLLSRKKRLKKGGDSK